MFYWDIIQHKFLLREEIICKFSLTLNYHIKFLTAVLLDRSLCSLTNTCLCFFQSSWKWWRENEWQNIFYHWSLCSYDLFSLQWASGHIKKNVSNENDYFYATSLCSSDSLYFHRCFYTYHILFYAICVYLEMCVYVVRSNTSITLHVK